MGINLPGLITQLISFAILVFLLTRFLYKPVVKLLDERAEKIKKGLSDAESASKGAEEAASKIEEELSQARLEGKKLIEAARDAPASWATLILPLMRFSPRAQPALPSIVTLGPSRRVAV